MEILEGKSRLAEKGHATFLWPQEFVTVATEELTVLVGDGGKWTSLNPNIRECWDYASLAQIYGIQIAVFVKRKLVEPTKKEKEK